MGMKDAFDPQRADLSAMSGPRAENTLYISAVIHKAFVKVDEDGTEVR
jgi:serpin B